jgi:hypothetical protein
MVVTNEKDAALILVSLHLEYSTSTIIILEPTPSFGILHASLRTAHNKHNLCCMM